MTSEIRLTATTLSMAVGLWLVAVDNFAFWRTLWVARDDSSIRGALALVALAVVLWALFSVLARALLWRWTGKFAIALLLVVAALAAHFIENYGIVVDRGMIRNVLQTDRGETLDLLTLPLLADVALRGLLPAAAVLVLRIDHRPWQLAVLSLGKLAMLFTVSAVAAAALFFGDYAATSRNHRELRHLLTPTNVLNGLYGVWKDRARVPLALTQVGGDARRELTDRPGKPLLVVLVVGETARAASFSLGGYERRTNVALAGKDITYFRDVTACGTDTATSLPCMFSDLGSDGFSISAASARENVLDVLTRAGITVSWLENNSGCKGVCQRVATQSMVGAAIPGVCEDNECFDEVLLRGLQQRLASTASDSLLILHMKGSHGPAYFRRVPASARRFKPTCDTSEIQRCSPESLRNSYDNSIAYTSTILAQTIDLLAAQADRVDSVVLYVSDHGESLGERNIYLHGMPMMFAPSEQTRVPMLAWLSAGAPRRLGLDRLDLQCAAQAPLSHDNLFHTLLGFFDVSTAAYRPSLDLSTLARNAAHARGAAATRGSVQESSHECRPLPRNSG